MEFRKYPKIHRYGKEETIGILDNPVTIQEKIDGANVSIWIDNETGKIMLASRNRVLDDNESFNGFREAVNNNPKIEEYFKSYPNEILYAEWLVKHSITYPNEAYKKIYLYDIYNIDDENNYTQDVVKLCAGYLGVEYPHIFIEDTLLTVEQIKEYVGKSAIAPLGEGVVIKDPDFRNKFGEMCYAKIVHENFKEANAVVFGGNDKSSENYTEQYIVNKYCTTARVEKIMQKLQATLEKKLDMEHTPMVAGSCYHDMITEEIWDIVTTKPIKTINFETLKRLCTKKFIHLYHGILNSII